MMMLFAGGLSSAEGRLSLPPDAAGSHDLSVAGAGAASEANPQIDAWHEEERRRIEADCDARMRALWAEKRNKLATIVDQRASEADATGRDLAAAQSKVEKELADLSKEKDEAEAERAKLPPKEAAVTGAKAEVQKWLDRIAELKRLIAEKKACVEALQQAQEDLADAKRRLAALKAKLAELMRQQDAADAAHARQLAALPPLQADV